jgi:hypothetical protein
MLELFFDRMFDERREAGWTLVEENKAKCSYRIGRAEQIFGEV